MPEEVLDWEGAYTEHGPFEGPPPWNIGEPQPELAAVYRAGQFRSDVLDAGCGVAELSLALAADGYTVVGVDLSPAAIAAASAAAAERGRSDRATFVVDDITSLSGYDGRFNTIVDSTLFHSLPVELRDDYLASVSRAAAPGARFYVLVFQVGAFPPGLEEVTPNCVTEDELHSAVSKRWEIDEIRPAFIHANVIAVPGFPAPPPEALDDKGRMRMPAFLLCAHKAVI